MEYDPSAGTSDIISNNTQNNENKRKRSPEDVIELLEEKIKQDPKNVNAWLDLLDEIRNRDKPDDIRDAYENALKVFPNSTKLWVDYIDVELSHSEFPRVEKLFSRCLPKVLNVQLWTNYLGYVRRVNNISKDGEAARNIISQAFEFVLAKIGVDRNSGQIWNDYIEFIKCKPTESTWEEQQKMDLTRKSYRKAIDIPLSNLNVIWQAYNNFENSLNKGTARKFIGEKSASYMKARSCYKELENLTTDIQISALPKKRNFTPMEKKQLEKWRKWIDWEKSNPLGLDNETDVQSRVIYAYKQAVMQLRYFAEIYFEAFGYCSQAKNSDEALEFLKTGLEANRTSFILSYKIAEVYEKEGQNQDVKVIYENLIKFLQEERVTLSSIEESVTEDNEKLQIQRKLIDNASDITMVYITFMRTLRRMEGIKEARKIFSEGRKLPYSTHQIYSASAYLEYHNNKDAGIASKIFEIGLKRFLLEPDYVIQYFNFLILVNDDVNARALFEKSVDKMEPEQAKPLYKHFIKYESDYGELSALSKLEDRFNQLYADEPLVNIFSERFDIYGLNVIQDVDLGERFKTNISAPAILDAENNESGDYDIDGESGHIKRARENEYLNEQSERSTPAATVPTGILNILSILPSSVSYGPPTFDPSKLARLLKDIKIPDTLV
ncbi:Suf-domain-containing protein [Nadsonia fulvescens var. elongata DSM 6958]|uniref:mRNA 3'-end-processing protein RNA14 n=1 Tax=Nadsonia fulvescens var. elongata DSM 6958 TaxID=857566 RepID=A0A1E3PJY5_9ASCO|nr:Suf-domain-containing protein [Nadsonia fulvescens var. elongata DSM 6958]